MAAGRSGRFVQDWVVDLRARSVVRFREAGTSGYTHRDEHRDGNLHLDAIPDVAVDLDELFG